MERIMSPKVSLIVTTHNALDFSRPMFKTLTKHTTHQPYEVVWVDSASTDGTRKWLETEIHRNTKKVFLPKSSLGLAMNRGFEACDPESKYIGDLDNDLLFPIGWLTRILEHLEADPKLASCTAARVKTGNFIAADDRAKMKEIKLGYRRWCSGCHTIFRREAIEDVGGWNPKLWFGEDKDIGLRMLRKGWRHATAVNVVVFHRQGVTTRRLTKEDPDWIKKMEASRDRMKEMYGR